MSKQDPFAVGQLVEHPLRPQWGPGRIVAKEGTRLSVFFRDDLGEKAKTILTEIVTLKVCDSQTDSVLDALAEPKFDGQHWVLPKPKAKRATKKVAAAAAV